MNSQSEQNITLKNPLDKFSTYSIHHILLACRTTQEAKAFMNVDNNEASIAAIDQVAQLGDAVPYPEPGSDSAFLVIDTRRFSQFTIEKMQYDVLINGLEKRGSHGNLATTVNMTIMDAIGISFINFIQWLMNEKMETNFDGMVFMHRIVFVGHTDDGKTETEQSVTIPMHLTKLELALDANRGTYTAEFMPNMNFDVIQHRRWLNIHDAHAYFTGTKSANNLGAIIDSFESQLNLASKRYWDETQLRFKDAGRLTENRKSYGRLVQYQITIPDDWHNMQIVGASTADATEIIHKKMSLEDQKRKDEAKKREEEAAKARTEAEKAAADEAKAAGTPPPQKIAVAKEAEPKSTHVTVETDRQITDVLDLIFKQVPAIAELGAGVKTVGTTGSVNFYKHFVGITSDETTITVHVDVVQFEVPNLILDKKDTTVSQGSDKFYQEIGDDGRRVPKNFMEFDYIFTGNNKDVLTFDMKLQDLQFMLASQLNLGPGVGGVTPNVGTKLPGNINDRSELITARAFDAILMPKKSDEELQNFKQYSKLLSEDKTLAAVKASNDYMRNLSMYYAMAPITAILTIRGNPAVMTKFNQNSFLPQEPIAESPTNTTTTRVTAKMGKHAKYRTEFENRILRGNVAEEGTTKVEQFTQKGSTFRVAETLGSTNYAMSPVFARVNIMGPNVDYRTGKQRIEGDFAERLLTDNFYVVFKVTNIIEGNSFTQQLELYSHNIFGLGKAVTGQ